MPLTAGPLSPALALGTAGKIHVHCGQSGRWAHRTQPDCRVGLCTSEKRVTDKLFSVSSFVNWVCVCVWGGGLISPSLTGIHRSTNEDDDQLFIMIKGIVAELHLLTVATVSCSRLWIWPYSLLTTVGICLFITILTGKTFESAYLWMNCSQQIGHQEGHEQWKTVRGSCT